MPVIPRMQVFEVGDAPWFPPFLRGYFQAALTAAWTTHVPGLQRSAPSTIVARLLQTHLPSPVSNYTFIDLCAGGGGPTPAIEQYLNTTPPQSTSQAAKAKFILTDLHPHTLLWEQAVASSQRRRDERTLDYVPHPVDAADVDKEFVERMREGGRRKVFRIFNLAFHHFDDRLARGILKGCVEGARVGEGFGIFELQDRTLTGFLACCTFGIATMLLAPYFALILWGEPLALVFTYAMPVLPAVLVFDGWMSCLRTRTPDEVEALLRTCGAEGGQEEIARRWEIRNGSETFMWPVGKVNWVIGFKKGETQGNGR